MFSSNLFKKPPYAAEEILLRSLIVMLIWKLIYSVDILWRIFS